MGKVLDNVIIAELVHLSLFMGIYLYIQKDYVPLILIELTQFYFFQKSYRIIFLLLWQTSWNAQCWRLSQGQQQFKNSKNMI